MEIEKNCYTFQVDSQIVKENYEQNSNYLIEYDEGKDNNICAVYFSSNDIYFPNTEEIFRKQIVEKNFFEWYKCRINKARKHIFIRDIFKQWYLKGINNKINTPSRLKEFLEKETNGYQTVMIGSSAGGYAAILYGSWLNANKVIAFNPQFEIYSLLQRSKEVVNPLVFRLRDTDKKEFYDISKWLNPNVPIFYFYSVRSKWDQEQERFIGNCYGIHKIAFTSNHHGIPFLKVALHKTINMSFENLKKLTIYKNSPLWFTIRLVGWKNTIKGLAIQLYSAYKKRH